MFDGDRIVESWFIPDRLGLWQQLGLLPAQQLGLLPAQQLGLLPEPRMPSQG